MAVVTDAQAANARGELHQVGLLGYFDPIVVSGDHGFRKPVVRSRTRTSRLSLYVELRGEPFASVFHRVEVSGRHAGA